MATTIQKSAGNGFNNNSSGTVAWTNVANISSSNDSRTLATGAMNTFTNFLEATNFGFSLNDTAIIE